LKFLNQFALLNSSHFQSLLGSDDYQVEVFHLVNFIINYSMVLSQSDSNRCKLIDETILLLGFYFNENTRNQEILNWGKSPTLLQKLCALPFQYFSERQYKEVLFPTLITSTFNSNTYKLVLQQEMSTEMLYEYLKHYASDNSNIDSRFHLQYRFPLSLLNDAASFFAPTE